jgi:putative heme-binding domain-containing protein
MIHGNKSTASAGHRLQVPADRLRRDRHTSGFSWERCVTDRMISQALRMMALVVAMVMADPVSGQRDLKVIPVPDPELERQTFRLPEGFEVNLFAADPAIAKPIQMNFDTAGRLWLVSSEVYPQIEPGQTANDRVLVLTDSDGDGVSDRTDVFADGLLIPTGIAPGDGGAYVANSTELLHFADLDGDLRADSKRVVLSGFGTEDTHHILHTLRWGLDGSLYFNQSIYIHSHIETPWGVRRLNAGGIWQFRPETFELGVFMRGLVNSWGHDFDRFGQSFATDGAGGEGINYIIPGAYYFTAADAARIVHGLNPGSPKHCGLEIVETPSLPPDWQGSAITNDFRGHRVCRFTLTDEGSGYISREQQEVISSDHVAFRPVDVKQGPDGAIYIADWYNPIIQHGEVDFRDERRDHTHGRIWRVTWTGAEQQSPESIADASNQELFESLRSADSFRRRAAKLTLRERGPEVAKELRAWLKDVPADDQLRLEALWCLQNLQVRDVSLLEQLLSSSEPRIRAAAVRVLTQWKFAIPGSADRLAEFTQDPHPRVRLEAIRGLSFSALQESQRESARLSGQIDAAELHSHAAPDRVEAALQALSLPMDPLLEYALWLTVREMAPNWLPAYEQQQITFGGDINQIVFAFRAIGGNAPIGLLLNEVYSSETDAGERAQLTELICSTADAMQLGRLFELAAAESDIGTLRRVEDVSTSRKVVPAVPDEVLLNMLQTDDAALRQLALRSAGRWQNAAASDVLEAMIADRGGDLEDRIAAATGVIAGGQQELVNAVVAQANASGESSRFSSAVVSELVAVQGSRAAKLLRKVLPKLADAPALVTQITESFLSQQQGAALLTEAVADVAVPADVGRQMLRVLRQSGRAFPELEGLIRTAASIPTRKLLTESQRTALLDLAMTNSSAAAGERVYRSPQLGCLKCHAIGGAGGKVGPDMISLGGSAQPDYLLESLLNPNAKVKENYHTVVIATTGGTVVSGVLRGQSSEAVTIRNADDVEIRVPRTEIEEIVPGVSLMPEGLVDALTDEELAALVRFLSELGRTPEFTLSRRRFARTWQVMQPTSDAAYRLRRTSYAMAATDDPAFQWQSTISKVDGSLPLEEIPVVAVKNRSAVGTRGVGFARTSLNVTTAGDIVLALNATSGIEMRVDDLPVTVQDRMELTLTAGEHRITLTVDQSVRSEPLVLELVNDSAADGGNAEFLN